MYLSENEKKFEYLRVKLNFTFTDKAENMKIKIWFLVICIVKKKKLWIFIHAF